MLAAHKARPTAGTNRPTVGRMEMALTNPEWPGFRGADRASRSRSPQFLVLLILIVRCVHIWGFDVDHGIGCRAGPVIDLVELSSRAAAVMIDRVRALLEPFISIRAFGRYKLVKGG